MKASFHTGIAKSPDYENHPRQSKGEYQLSCHLLFTVAEKLPDALSTCAEIINLVYEVFPRLHFCIFNLSPPDRARLLAAPADRSESSSQCPNSECDGRWGSAT